MGLHVGYCTNVHAGRDLGETRRNLERHARAVKAKSFPDQPMGVGLWLSAPVAAALDEESQLTEFRDWLSDEGLVPYTFNGFPYGDFHQPVVKHLVYEPTWMDRRRLDYTIQLMRIQNALLPEGLEGSISTLPIGWGTPTLSVDQREAAAQLLREAAAEANRIEQETGRLIYLCIEPEPGCFIQRTDDMIRFMHEDLWRGADEDVVRRHVRVCHDVCHAVVMFESQGEVFRKYASAGVAVGKIQVSSAVRLPAMNIGGDRSNALAQLAAFREERYLHQTSVRSTTGEERFFEDLPLALAAAEGNAEIACGEWRVHFHVPIYVEQFGDLFASRSDIVKCLSAAKEYSDVSHFEVETYAWGVLPQALQTDDLSDGIAKELTWFDQQYADLA